MKENTKKTCMLIYILTFIVISSFSFVIPNTNKSWIGNPLYRYLWKNVYVEHRFLKCKYYDSPTLYDGKPIPIETCLHKTKNIEIDGTIINADKYVKSLDHSATEYERHQKSQEFLIIDKFNRQNRNVARIRHHTFYNTKGALKTTLISMWLAFVFSLPLIWISRNISISIVSLMTKVWKKI
jgi:hypothetical protein|tara:strand:+ start:121 stop:666 length:546 start_codon:yes stop_codon:yes gene_type:complete